MGKVLAELGKPDAHIGKGLGVGNVVAEDAGVCAAVIQSGYRSESFLAGWWVVSLQYISLFWERTMKEKERNRDKERGREKEKREEADPYPIFEGEQRYRYPCPRRAL